MRQRRISSEGCPQDESQHADGKHGRHEIGRDTISQALNLGSTSLRLSYQAHDLCQCRLSPDSFRFHDHAARSIQRSAD